MSRASATAMPGDGTARLMFYALLAITLMALDYRGQYVDRLHAIGARLAEPLILAVGLPVSGISQSLEKLRQRAALEQELDALRLESARLRALLSRTVDLERENTRLRGLLAAGRRAGFDFIAAELMAVDLDPFAHRIVVRGGRRDDVRRGMPVIDDRGVIGQVDEVMLYTARVVLISDPDHALPVQILPSGERTILYGSGLRDRLRLSDLPMNTPIEPGDLIVTSGLGGRFPAGLPVARVRSLSRPAGQPFASAEAVALAAMDRNRVVLLLAPTETEPGSELGSELGSEPGSDPSSGPEPDAAESTRQPPEPEA